MMGCFRFVLQQLCCLTFLAVFVLGNATPAFSSSESTIAQRGAALKAVTVDEQLGKVVDPDLMFTAENGKKVRLGDFFTDGKPVLLTLNYYSCATLCSAQLNGLLQSMKELDWTAGKEFRIITVSIDPKESAALAKDKRQNYLKELGKGEIEWHFWVGHESQIKVLADSVGFRYAYDPVAKQYAHPAVIFFLSSKGIVARYLYGIQYKVRDLKFSLIEAAEGRVGSVVDKVIMSCFAYDYSVGKYTPTAFGIMRLGGLASILCLGTFSLVMWRREIINNRAWSEK